MIIKRKQIHDNTHLTLEERKIIQARIENNSTKASIARTIENDATIIAKQIRKHRTLKPLNTFNRPILYAKLNTCPKKPQGNANSMKSLNVIAVTNLQVHVTNVMNEISATWTSTSIMLNTPIRNITANLSIRNKSHN